MPWSLVFGDVCQGYHWQEQATSRFDLPNGWAQHHLFLVPLKSWWNVSHAGNWTSHVPSLRRRIDFLCRFEEYLHLVDADRSVLAFLPPCEWWWLLGNELSQLNYICDNTHYQYENIKQCVERGYRDSIENAVVCMHDTPEYLRCQKKKIYSGQRSNTNTWSSPHKSI